MIEAKGYKKPSYTVDCKKLYKKEKKCQKSMNKLGESVAIIGI
jgi:hypothetical protein